MKILVGKWNMGLQRGKFSERGIKGKKDFGREEFWEIVILGDTDFGR